MPVVAKDNDVLTVIDIYSVEPSCQQQLVDSLVDYIETALKQQPGFVSASIHKSLDTVRVANYAQWKSRQDYEAFAKNSDVQSLTIKLSKFPKPDSHLYEIAISKPEDSIPKISKGSLTIFEEFRLKPENQQSLLELEREKVVVAMKQPGILSANFHRSLDGTRIMNYAQLRSQAAVGELAKQPGFTSDNAYWSEVAENEFHLYEVVFTASADFVND